MLDIIYVDGGPTPWKVIEVFENKVIAQAPSQDQARNMKQELQDNNKGRFDTGY